MTTRAQAQDRAMESMNRAKENLAAQEPDLVADLWQSGLTQREIASRLGMGRSYVQRRLTGMCSNEERRARIKRNHGRRVVWTDDMLSALMALRKSGKSQTECAKMVGVDLNATKKKLKELGLNARMKVDKPPQIT